MQTKISICLDLIPDLVFGCFKIVCPGTICRQGAVNKLLLSGRIWVGHTLQMCMQEGEYLGVRLGYKAPPSTCSYSKFAPALHSGY